VWETKGQPNELGGVVAPDKVAIGEAFSDLGVSQLAHGRVEGLNLRLSGVLLENGLISA